MKETITVGIPVHNEDKSIEITLDSISDQELPDGVSLEIIACDNGSTDRTREKVREYIRVHPEANIKLLEIEEASKSKAWNRIVQEAMTEYLVFCDGDVLLRRDAITNLYEMAKANPEKKAISGHSRGITRQEPHFWEKLGLVAKEVYGKLGIMGGLYLIKSEFCRDLTIPDNITEDVFLGTQIGFENIKRCYDAVVYHPVISTLRDYFLLRTRSRVHQLNLKRNLMVNVDRSKAETFHSPKGEEVLSCWESFCVSLAGRAVRLGAKIYAQYRFMKGDFTWDNIPTSKIGDMFNSYEEAKAYITAHNL